MKQKIMAAVIILALIPAILLGAGINYYMQTAMQTDRLNTLAGMTRAVDIHLKGRYELLVDSIHMKSDEETLLNAVSARESDNTGPIDRNEVVSILTEPIGFPVMGGALIDRSGKTLVSTWTDDEGVMLNETELYREIMNGKTCYIGTASVDSQFDLLDIAVPIYDDRGAVIGILRQNIEMDFLRGYLGSLNSGKSGFTFLIRKNGSMIFDKDKNYQTVLYHDYQNKNSLDQLVQDFKSDSVKEDKGFVEFESKGNEYIGAYELIEPIDCIAVVAADRNEIYGDANPMKVIFLSVALAMLAIIAVCGYLIGSRYVTPLKMLNNTLNAIANGDMSARCNFKKKYEFGELSRGINNLADNYQKSEKRLRISSRIDSLTLLPNRAAIYEVLDTLLYKHPNQAILLLNLEDFKEVNDNLGYEIGDRILTEVGDILRDLPQHVCYPSRLGGTEFMVFLTNWTVSKYPEVIAEKIINKIHGIRFIDEIHVDIGVSIGIEYTGDEKLDKKKLIRHSNIAMHKAKSVERNSYFVYYPYLPKAP